MASRPQKPQQFALLIPDEFRNQGTLTNSTVDLCNEAVEDNV